MHHRQSVDDPDGFERARPGAAPHPEAAITAPFRAACHLRSGNAIIHAVVQHLPLGMGQVASAEDYRHLFGGAADFHPEHLGELRHYFLGSDRAFGGRGFAADQRAGEIGTSGAAAAAAIDAGQQFEQQFDPRVDRHFKKFINDPDGGSQNQPDSDQHHGRQKDC